MNRTKLFVTAIAFDFFWGGVRLALGKARAKPALPVMRRPLDIPKEERKSEQSLAKMIVTIVVGVLGVIIVLQNFQPVETTVLI